MRIDNVSCIFRRICIIKYQKLVTDFNINYIILALNLLVNMLNKNPAKRIPCEIILKHPYFSSEDLSHLSF